LDEKISNQEYNMQQTNEDKAQLILRIDQMLEDHRFDKERYGYLDGLPVFIFF